MWLPLIQVSNSYCYSNASLHFFLALFVPSLHFKFRNNRQTNQYTRQQKYLHIQGMSLIIQIYTLNLPIQQFSSELSTYQIAHWIGPPKINRLELLCVDKSQGQLTVFAVPRGYSRRPADQRRREKERGKFFCLFPPYSFAMCVPTPLFVQSCCSKKPHGWLNPTSFLANFLILTSHTITYRGVIYCLVGQTR